MPARGGEPSAAAEVNAHYRGADPGSFALHDAQVVLARAYGFQSWPKLKAYVDGMTAKRLIEAVRAGEMETVEAMLRARPELANMGTGQDERRALHYAVLDRSAGMTRVLMWHGADARAGIYPHREATSPLTLAEERGYDDIVAVIREEEQRRREAHAGKAAAAPDELFLVANWESGRALEMLKSDPSLLDSASPNGGTPLHAAACELHEEAVAWLLDHGADPHRRLRGKWTPIDLAAKRRSWGDAGHPTKFKAIAALLLGRGADLGPFSAVALGAEDWLRARHAEGVLANPAECDPVAGCMEKPWRWRCGTGGPRSWRCCSISGPIRTSACAQAAPTRSSTPQGGPLFCCVIKRSRAMAEMLLARGADPNANVYTSGSPFYRAYSEKNQDFVKLLEEHGGFLDAISAGYACQTEAARKLLEDEAAGRLRPGAVIPGNIVAEDLIWTGAGGGDPEIVRLALDRIEWPRDDSRWLYPLWQAFTCDGGVERGLECFRLLLDRADPNLSDHGRTILHTVMAHGSMEHVPFAEMLMDAGARVDLRDELLESTALGWACRWGRVHFVKLLLARGADPIERDAAPWATPKAWAQKMKHDKVLAVLRKHGGQSDADD